MSSNYTIDDVLKNTGAPTFGSTPNFQNSFDEGVAPSSLTSGELQGNTILQDGYLKSSNYVAGTSGWLLEPDSAEFNVGVSVDSLDIPDTATANSFHVETDGDSFWGCTPANFTSNNNNAAAYILKTGQAKFQNVSIGGTTNQFTANNNGMFTFGDGSDGAAAFDGATAVNGFSRSGSTYTATRDTYFTNATISTGVTVKPAGYRMFGTGTLTLNGTAKIERNGNAGANGTVGQEGGPGGAGSGGAGGNAGAALADGYLKGSLAGSNGTSGGTGGASTGPVAPTAGGNSSNGTSTSNSLGSNGRAGGAGGAGGAGAVAGGAGGTVGTAGTATAYNVAPIDPWSVHWVLDVSSTGSTVKYDNSAASTGGTGGGGGAYGGGNGGGGGGGGGAGSPGGIVAIYFRSIVIGASASITANGGAGGNGANGGNANGDGSGGGGGGGGAGGNGGQIILVYNTLTNSGTLTASGGAAGTAGTGGSSTGAGNTGVTGTAGTAGVAGNIRQFQISL